MYEKVGSSGSGSWAWEYNPPPYDFLAPSNSAPMPAPLLTGRGLGCDGKPCAKCSAAKVGMGLFDGGLDVTTWTATEWMVAAAAGLVAVALLDGGPRVRERRGALRSARLDYLQEREKIRRRYRPRKKKVS